MSLKPQDIRELDDKAIKEKLFEIEKSLITARISSMGSSTNKKELKVLKKDRARVLTIMRERELGINQNIVKKVKNTNKPENDKSIQEKEKPKSEEKPKDNQQQDKVKEKSAPAKADKKQEQQG